jgi:O-antigen/teichoic acid export membrane protein
MPEETEARGPGPANGLSKLLRQWPVYLAGRILPAVISFGGIALYTRLLDPASFGVSALLLSSALFVGGTGYSWVRVAALRAAGSYDSFEPDFAATLAGCFAATSVVVWLVLALAVRLWNPSLPLGTLLITLAAATTFGWFDLNTSVLQSRLHVVSFSVQYFARAVLGLCATVLLINAGTKAFALIGGFTASNFVSCFGLGMWRPVLRGRFDPALARKLFVFGWPASAGVLMSFAPSAQRYILGFSRGSAAVGIFAVASDFSTQTIGLLIATASLAGQPLAFQAKDRSGDAVLLGQLRENAELIFAIALPSATAVALLAAPIASIFMGKHFQAGAGTIVALGAVATLLVGLRGCYFDQAFAIAYNMRPTIVINAIQAAVCVGLTLFFVGSSGAVGAAFACVVANLIALVVSAIWGRRCTVVPIPLGGWMKTSFSTLAMAAAILVVPERGTLGGFAAAVCAGGAAYALALAVVRRDQIYARIVRRPA